MLKLCFKVVEDQSIYTKEEQRKSAMKNEENEKKQTKIKY